MSKAAIEKFELKRSIQEEKTLETSLRKSSNASVQQKHLLSWTV